MSSTSNRVSADTASHVNEEIERAAERPATQPRAALSRRIDQLDRGDFDHVPRPGGANAAERGRGVWQAANV